MKRIPFTFSLLLVFGLISLVAPAVRSQGLHSSLQLRLGYKVVIDEPWFEDVDYDSLISSLKLMKGGKTIFTDTNEYYSWEKDELYPLVLHFGSDHDEILLKYYDKLPTENVLRLFIKDGSVVKVDTLPSFWGPSDFAGDGKPRFAAFWDYGKWTTLEDRCLTNQSCITSLQVRD
jgi:hypothetical protein